PSDPAPDPPVNRVDDAGQRHEYFHLAAHPWSELDSFKNLKSFIKHRTIGKREDGVKSKSFIYIDIFTDKRAVNRYGIADDVKISLAEQLISCFP
ncbi:MAG: hypothetical protein NWR42_05620, partial [Desulfobacterales bacterium]|nr:hypothetical protein [Desulfobacterales bacterium]